MVKPVGHSASTQSKRPTTVARPYYRALCQCGQTGPWRVYRETAERDSEQHVRLVALGATVG
jgi:hypothetical protein